MYHRGFAIRLFFTVFMLAISTLLIISPPQPDTESKRVRQEEGYAKLYAFKAMMNQPGCDLAKVPLQELGISQDNVKKISQTSPPGIGVEIELWRAQIIRVPSSVQLVEPISLRGHPLPDRGVGPGQTILAEDNGIGIDIRIVYPCTAKNG